MPIIFYSAAKLQKVERNAKYICAFPRRSNFSNGKVAKKREKYKANWKNIRIFVVENDNRQKKRYASYTF